MSRFFAFTLVCCTLGLVTAETHAAMVLRWDMNSPTPLDDSAGSTDLIPPGGGANPTHLATGGAFGTGAYEFDGVNDRFAITGGAYNLGPLTSDWTTSFWIETTDAGTTNNYNGTPHLPVLGDATGAIGWGVGIHGGFAAYRHYTGAGPFGGWVHASGTVGVADGEGHFVTFVYHGSPTTPNVDVYIDGAVDVLGLATGAGGSPTTFRDVGRSWSNWFGGNFVLDDVQIVDRALSAAEIEASFSPPPPPTVPEPATWTLLGLGAAVLTWKAQRRSQSVR